MILISLRDWAALVLCVYCLLGVSRASAQAAESRPSASILRAAGADAEATASLDRLLRERLDSLDVVRLERAVELDLEQVQLALGCMGETEPCLRAVAEQLSSDIVLSPSLTRAGEAWVVSVTLFDARESAVRRVARRDATVSAVLGDAESLLRELFGLPPVATSSHGDGVLGSGTPRPPSAPGLSPWPFVLIGVGAAAIIGGSVAGGLAAADQGAYESSRPMTAMQVDETLSLLSRAQSEALAANILWVTGAAFAVGGLIWLLVAGNDDSSSPIALMPGVGPEGASLSLAGRFEGAL